jgi:hypothetical protein
MQAALKTDADEDEDDDDAQEEQSHGMSSALQGGSTPPAARCLACFRAGGTNRQKT